MPMATLPKKQLRIVFERKEPEVRLQKTVKKAIKNADGHSAEKTIKNCF